MRRDEPAVRLYMKRLLFCLWMAFLFAAIIIWLQSGLHPTDIPQILQNKLEQFGLIRSGILYIFIYTFRPITLFPAMWLTIISGYLFGPWLGILFTIIGENFSANLAFLMARYFGADFVQSHETNFMKKWDCKLQENGLVTVMIMRFIYLPFDGVNFVCGMTSIRQRDFAIGTIIGIMPGLITFALLGGAASARVTGMLMVAGLEISQKAFVLGLSILFFLLGMIISKKVKSYDSKSSP